MRVCISITVQNMGSDKIKCPQCGEKNKAKHKFCQECGAPLHGQTEPGPTSSNTTVIVGGRPRPRVGAGRRMVRRTARRTARRVGRRR